MTPEQIDALPAGREVEFFDRLGRDDEPGDPLTEARSKVEATRAAIAKAEAKP